MSHQIKRNTVSDKRMTVAEAAYVAGVTEGEGHIGLTVLRIRPGVRDQVSPVFKISNTNLRLLERLVEATGNGAIWQKNLTALAHRLCYDWTLSANQIRHVLPQLLPYLIGKAPQAELVLEYLGLVRGHLGVADADLPRSVEIRLELSALNKRGGSEEEKQATRAEFGKQECSVEECRQRTYRGHPVCYTHWQTLREVSIRRCEQCGKDIEVKDARKRFCSPQCQMARWNTTVALTKRRAAAATREPGICPACGKNVDRTGYAAKQYCDAHCQSVWRARQKKRTAPEV